MQARDFHLPRWLRSAHLQTLGAAAPLFSPPSSHAAMGTEELRIPLAFAREGRGDDDPASHALHAAAWWATDADGQVARRLAVVVVHGIGGSSASRYVVRAAVALHRAGHHVVRLDLRGAGASIPDAPSLYHAGLSADLGVVVSELARDARVDGVVLLGFSGGGSMALKLAGELGDAAPAALRGVVSISAPLDYTRVGAWMDTMARLPYRFHVLRGLSNGARDFATTHPSRAHYRPRDVKRMSTFRHYDSTIIVPMHGFSDVDAYYAAASPGPWLDRIRVPTLLMHADDDPMVPGATVRPWLEKASPAVRVELTPHGGHLGWVAGFDEASWITCWPVRRTLSFLDELAPRT